MLVRHRTTRGHKQAIIKGMSQKTKAELQAFLHEAVPDLVYRYLIRVGSLRQCGSISDAFGTIARDAGFEAFVSSRPGHFYNVVRVSDGVFEVDLSAVQFEFDRWAEDEDAEMERLMAIIAHDPFRAIKVRRIEEVPAWAHEPPPEEGQCYAPVAGFKRGYTKRLMRGEYGRVDGYMKDLLQGRPYAQGMRPIELEVRRPSHGMRRIELVERRVMQRLLEAGRRVQGQWHDVDHGRGGSVYNRNEPRRRTSSQAPAAAGSRWDSWTPEQRAEMLEVEMGGYDAKARGGIAQSSWAQLPDVIGSEKMQGFARIVMTWARDLASSRM